MSMTITKEVREELEALSRKHGALSEAVVVQASKRKTSALHSMFMWDDEAGAAQIGREEIARRLIMRVRVTIEEAEDLRVHVNTRKYMGGVGGGYHALDEVLSREDLRKQLMASAKRDLLAARHRYKLLQELGAVMHAIDEAFPEGS